MKMEKIHWLEQEEQRLLNSRALSHPLFIKHLNDLCLDRQWLAACMRQMYHVVLGFPFSIAAAISTTTDEDVLRVLVLNLHAEVGGFGDEAHISIFRQVLIALGESVDRLSETELWDETYFLERSCRESYSNNDMGIKLGSLFAFEAISSPMVSHWSNAFASTGQYKPSEYRFFTIHIDVEKDHVESLKYCIAKYSRSDHFKASFFRGVRRIEHGLSLWWDRLLLESKVL
jgi:pyrroloquinoline quinone (PQQ) biosynthesis protein C